MATAPRVVVDVINLKPVEALVRAVQQAIRDIDSRQYSPLSVREDLADALERLRAAGH